MRRSRSSTCELPSPPSVEIIDDLQAGFPAEQLQYLQVFTNTTVSEAQFGGYAQALRQSDDQIRAALDGAGITRSVITVFDERSTCGVTFVHNESIAALTVTRNASSRSPAPSCGAARRWPSCNNWVVDCAFRGLSLRPFTIGRPATDGACFPSTPSASSWASR